MGIDHLLLQLGLERKEVIIYLICFSLGTQRATVIAEKSGIKRTTVHLVLGRLTQKNILTVHWEKSVQFFTAVPPEKLVIQLDEKISLLESHKRQLENSLLEFQKLLHPYQRQSKVQFFSGISGVKQVMEDILTARTEVLCYSAIEAWLSSDELRVYMEDYSQRRVKKHIQVRSINIDSPRAKEYLKKKKGIEVRWQLGPCDLFTNEVNIYEGKLAICSLDPKDFFGIIIESESVANTQKSIFELTWLMAEKRGIKVGEI